MTRGVVILALVVGFAVSVFASAQETCQSQYRQVGFSTTKHSGYTCKTTYWFNR